MLRILFVPGYRLQFAYMVCGMIKIDEDTARKNITAIGDIEGYNVYIVLVTLRFRVKNKALSAQNKTDRGGFLV